MYRSKPVDLGCHLAAGLIKRDASSEARERRFDHVEVGWRGRGAPSLAQTLGVPLAKPLRCGRQMAGSQGWEAKSLWASKSEDYSAQRTGCDDCVQAAWASTRVTQTSLSFARPPSVQPTRSASGDSLLAVPCTATACTGTMT